MNIVAMSPARLGSKRVKNKNLRLLDGKPLVAHVVSAAKGAEVFSDIYINSEADIFAQIANQQGVKFYKRSPEFASDEATNDMFVNDFIGHVPCDIIIQINPTSPFISADIIRQFVRTMVENDYDTLHSVKEEQIEGLYRGNALNFDPLKPMPRSQDLEPIILFSSGIMGWKVSAYRSQMKKYGCATYGGDGKIGYFTLKGFATIDIDLEEDFQIAELAMAYQKNPQLFPVNYWGV